MSFSFSKKIFLIWSELLFMSTRWNRTRNLLRDWQVGTLAPPIKLKYIQKYIVFLFSLVTVIFFSLFFPLVPTSDSSCYSITVPLLLHIWRFVTNTGRPARWSDGAHADLIQHSDCERSDLGGNLFNLIWEFPPSRLKWQITVGDGFHGCVER